MIKWVIKIAGFILAGTLGFASVQPLDDVIRRGAYLAVIAVMLLLARVFVGRSDRPLLEGTRKDITGRVITRFLAGWLVGLVLAFVTGRWIHEVGQFIEWLVYWGVSMGLTCLFFAESLPGAKDGYVFRKK